MDQVQKAIEVLNNGGVIIYPTDTAYGIGCRVDDEKAVQRLFEVRRRPENKATPVLVSSVAMAKEYMQEIPEEVQSELIEKYWPGALTIVLNARLEKIPSLVRGGTNTVGLRMQNNQTILDIIQGVGVPILGPSANFSGEKTPYSLEEVDPELLKMVDFVVKGECSVKQASTVIDVTRKPWKVLREGAVILSV